MNRRQRGHGLGNDARTATRQAGSAVARDNWPGSSRRHWTALEPAPQVTLADPLGRYDQGLAARVQSEAPIGGLEGSLVKRRSR